MATNFSLTSLYSEVRDVFRAFNIHKLFSERPHFMWLPCKRFYPYAEMVFRKNFVFY